MGKFKKYLPQNPMSRMTPQQVNDIMDKINWPIEPRLAWDKIEIIPPSPLSIEEFNKRLKGNNQ